MKWCGLATSLRMSALGFNCGKARAYSEPARSATIKPTQALWQNSSRMAKTKDVPPGQAAAFTIEGQKIALFNVEGTYYAIGDTCTHRGGPLSEGDVQGTKV